MYITDWISNNYIEIFGAVTGILYVFLEIKQNIWLWPVGITTSAVYIWVFFTSKFYADMSLQGYYLVISILGWYWWVRRKNGRMGEWEKGGRRKSESESESESERLRVTRINVRTTLILSVLFLVLQAVMYMVLDRLTDSPVPFWDSFITTLSVIATWMLARKIYEHWYLWIIVNAASVIIFCIKGLYPTVVLYIIYCVMSFIGLREWKKSL